MPNSSKNDKTRKGGSGKQQGGQGKNGQTSRENKGGEDSAKRDSDKR